MWEGCGTNETVSQETDSAIDMRTLFRGGKGHDRAPSVTSASIRSAHRLDWYSLEAPVVDDPDGPYFRFAIKLRPDNIRLLDHLITPIMGRTVNLVNGGKEEVYL